MKESLEIRRLYHEDDIEELIFMHQDISVSNKLKGILIYYDYNFISFIKKALLNLNEYFYGLFDNKDLVGFIHFKCFDKSLFLNNIYVKVAYRKGGTGKFFLKHVLSVFRNDFDFFTLDVIKSNTHVYDWYLRMGLRCLVKKEWIKIIPNTTSFKKKILFIRKLDENGFDSVFVSDEKVATIINNQNLILHDLTLTNEIGYLGLDIYACVEVIDDVKSKFATLEIVERLTGDFNLMIKGLYAPS